MAALPRVAPSTFQWRLLQRALEESIYLQPLTSASFTDIEVEVTQRNGLQDIAESGARASVVVLSAAIKSLLETAKCGVSPYRVNQGGVNA